jgi:hypothetical protein
MRKNLLALFLVAGLFGWLDLWNYFFQYSFSAQETTAISEQSPQAESTATQPPQMGTNTQCNTCPGGSGNGGVIRGGPPPPPPTGRPR